MQGIGLLEPIWKLISAIVNWQLMQHIQFHDDIHGFLPSCSNHTLANHSWQDGDWQLEHPSTSIAL